MKRERQAILSLVAMGRITPGEAERLLAAWNSAREEVWVIGACVVACIAQSLPALATVLPGGSLSGLLQAVSGLAL
jgi:hypothetical protein